jgi:hypothetical protein
MPRQQTRRYPIGSISSATMRPDDLIPTFLSELATQMREGPRIKGHAKLWRAIDKRSDKPNYYESEDADWDLESLFDALNGYAGPYFYFGANEGDGADYGFWLSMDSIDEAVRCKDLLKVGDLADVPSDYRGEVLLVNDHGNATLYIKTSRAMREVWAIV